MTELLAVLTSIYVLYVLYQIFQTISQSDIATQTVTAQAPKPEQAAPAPAAQPPITPPPAPSKPTVSTPAVAESAPITKPAPAATAAAKIVNLRNPLTGEVSPVPGNYRFAKKWIKEAIVAEGLLNKVYKNSELTEAVNPKVKEAIEAFKKLEKYYA